MKKALKGLSGIKVFEILEDTETNYRVGEPISIPYAQSLTRDVQSSSDPTYADDAIYDDEEIIEGEDFELQIPEAELELFPILEGGTYDEEKKEYNWGGNASKDYAMTFKAKKKDGNYRMFRYYKVKFKKVKQDLVTADNSTTISVLTISGTFYKRAHQAEGEVFPSMRTYKDSEKASDLLWLDTIPTIPATTIKTISVAVPDGQANLLGKTAETLQENIVISGNGEVTGTLKNIEEFDKFSKGAKGNFLALYFDEAKNGENVMCELKGTGAAVKKPKAVDKTDGFMVFNVHNNDNTIEVTCEGRETRILSLSGLTLNQS